MLPVLFLPRPLGENLGRKFPGPSLRSELAQPMCRAAYSPTLEKRELGMTKVTGITVSYARCKLSNNFEGLRRPLTSEDKMARTPSSSAPSCKVEVIASTVQMNAIGFFGIYYREELLREYAYRRSREVSSRTNRSLTPKFTQPIYLALTLGLPGGIVIHGSLLNEIRGALFTYLCS